MLEQNALGNIFLIQLYYFIVRHFFHETTVGKINFMKTELSVYLRCPFECLIARLTN
jgi:hypothetical protein